MNFQVMPIGQHLFQYKCQRSLPRDGSVRARDAEKRPPECSVFGSKDRLLLANWAISLVFPERTFHKTFLPCPKVPREICALS